MKCLKFTIRAKFIALGVDIEGRKEVRPFIRPFGGNPTPRKMKNLTGKKKFLFH